MASFPLFLVLIDQATSRGRERLRWLWTAQIHRFHPSLTFSYESKLLEQPKAYYRASTMKIEDGLIYTQPTSFHCSQPIGTFDTELEHRPENYQRKRIQRDHKYFIREQNREYFLCIKPETINIILILSFSTVDSSWLATDNIDCITTTISWNIFIFTG